MTALKRNADEARIRNRNFNPPIEEGYPTRPNQTTDEIVAEELREFDKKLRRVPKIKEKNA